MKDRAQKAVAMSRLAKAFRVVRPVPRAQKRLHGGAVTSVSDSKACYFSSDMRSRGLQNNLDRLFNAKRCDMIGAFVGMSVVRPLRIWYRREFPQWLRHIIYWGLLIALGIVGDYALLYFLTVLTASNLIEWRTVISFLAVEVLAAVVARMMGLGHESYEETLYRRLRLEQLKATMLPRYAHLEVVCLKGEEEEYPEYPKSKYYIINKEKGSAYWVTDLYCRMTRDGIIIRRVFPNVTSLIEYLNELKIELNPRKAEGYELESLRKPEKENSD